MRQLSIDDATVELLRKHQTECAKRFALTGKTLDRPTFMFSAAPDRSSPL